MNETKKTSITKILGLPLEIFVLIIIIIVTLATPIPYDELIPVLISLLLVIKKYRQTGEISEADIKNVFYEKQDDKTEENGEKGE